MPDTPLNPDATRRGYISHGAGLNAACNAYYSPGRFSFPDPTRMDKAIQAYLAVAQPEVNSVEAVPAQVQVISWEEEPEHECWKLAPDETFVGLIVKSDRAWSPADRYTLNIERPEVNDA